MPLRQLRAMYEKRRHVLSNMLQTDRTIDRSRREQIHGAITEIDTLLKTIDNLREQEIQDNQSLDAKMDGSKDIIKKGSELLQKINERIHVKFENSQTKKNLMNVFVRKCETKTRYEFFSKLAKNEGYESISHVFSEFAEHENQHARILFKMLNLDHDTFDNIREAADIEQNYHKNIYSEFETVAIKENFKDIAELFKDLAQIEAEHEKKFLRLLRKFHEKRIFKNEHVVKWKCRNCGHVAEAKEAPKRCPVCKESQGYFELHVE